MDYAEKKSEYYTYPRYDMLRYVPQDISKVLEIGCGNGVFIKLIKENLKRDIESWGIELMEEYAEEARSIIDNVQVGKCEELIPNLPDNYFDLIIFNDVLEHLLDPKSVLMDLKGKLTNKGKIICSIPNMRYHENLFGLVFKSHWEYEDSGIMDFTHLKFYTHKSIKKLFSDSGYNIDHFEGISKTKSLKPYLFRLLLFFGGSDIFYKQFAVVASKR
ncbi:Methyltransferase domain-containing protein [Moheibacter sediminis]|uniref:Methyltransferase domain-containing protein n=2 Tax=Moheibacter sediminis TaxID=1434700 RepID=A0A1W2BFS8_9FLAO|nr:Methyltransferase domain-containing protein [Moheibacter sediminis]